MIWEYHARSVMLIFSGIRLHISSNLPHDSAKEPMNRLWMCSQEMTAARTFQFGDMLIYAVLDARCTWEAHVETSGANVERHCPLYAAVRGGHAEAVSRLLAGRDCKLGHTKTYQDLTCSYCILLYSIMLLYVIVYYCMILYVLMLFVVMNYCRTVWSCLPAL